MSETAKVFPSSKHEALAYLYTQAQDLSGKSPSDILDIYNSAYAEIVNKTRELNGAAPIFTV